MKLNILPIVGLAGSLIVSGAPLLHGQGIDLEGYVIVDLTHPLNAESVFWPTSPSRFVLERLAYGETDGGWFSRPTPFRPRSTAAPTSTRRFTSTPRDRRSTRYRWPG